MTNLKCGSPVRIKTTGEYGVLVSLQPEHNRYQLSGKSGWRYGLSNVQVVSVLHLVELAQQGRGIETITQMLTETLIHAKDALQYCMLPHELEDKLSVCTASVKAIDIILNRSNGGINHENP